MPNKISAYFGPKQALDSLDQEHMLVYKPVEKASSHLDTPKIHKGTKSLESECVKTQIIIFQKIFICSSSKTILQAPARNQVKNMPSKIWATSPPNIWYHSRVKRRKARKPRTSKREWTLETNLSLLQHKTSSKQLRYTSKCVQTQDHMPME